MNRSWNLITHLKTQLQSVQGDLEQDLEAKATGLPIVGNWTRQLIQVILLGIAAGVGWAIFARVDVVVNATGKLEPLSQSQGVQSHAGGIVSSILVREGEAVKQGQLLLQLDKTNLHNRLQALLIQRNRLVKETAVLRITREDIPSVLLNPDSAEVSPELKNQVQTRLLLKAQLTGDTRRLTAEQSQRYSLYQQQLRDRGSLTNLQQLDIGAKIQESEAQSAQIGFQLQTERELLERLRPLVEQGAIPRVTLLQRQVTVSELQKQVTQNQLQKRQLELARLQTRVEADKVLNETKQDLQRQLADLDAKFDSIIKENQRQLVEINSQLSQIWQELKHQDLRAPTDGVVFGLGPKLPGVITQPGQTLLQIVPNETLIARVQVANADIANIRVGMPVDIRIDAYPFTEYGSIKGVVSKVGNEAIPLGEPTKMATVFPIEVKLDRQFLSRKSEQLPLTPGMTAVAMLKVRQRAPISYVTEELTKAFDGMKAVR